MGGALSGTPRRAPRGSQGPVGRALVGAGTRRSFADSKTQDLEKMIPRVLSTVAAIAVAKLENRGVEERRRLAQEEAARRFGGRAAPGGA